jgi:hypothetical protein
MVDAQPADDCHQKRPRRPYLLIRIGSRSLLPPDKSLLQHVLRIGHAPQHAIRNREEQTPMLIEHSQPRRNLFIASPRRNLFIPSLQLAQLITINSVRQFASHKSGRQLQLQASTQTSPLNKSSTVLDTRPDSTPFCDSPRAGCPIFATVLSSLRVGCKPLPRRSPQLPLPSPVLLQPNHKTPGAPSLAVSSLRVGRKPSPPRTFARCRCRCGRRCRCLCLCLCLLPLLLGKPRLQPWPS